MLLIVMLMKWRDGTDYTVLERAGGGKWRLGEGAQKEQIGREGKISHLNGMEPRTKTETSGLTVRVLIKWLPYTMGYASQTFALVSVYLLNPNRDRMTFGGFSKSHEELGKYWILSFLLTQWQHWFTS